MILLTVFLFALLTSGPVSWIAWAALFYFAVHALRYH